MITDREAYLKARRKTKVVSLPESDDQMEIWNLTAAGYCAMLECQNNPAADNFRRIMTVVKWGVPAFAALTVEECLDTVLMEDAMFLQTQIMELSGTGEDSEKES